MAGMDAVPKEVLRAAYKRNPFYNPLKITFAFGLWAAMIVLLYQTQDSRYFIPIGIGVSLMVAYLVRGLGAIAHDAVHGNVARGKLAGYLVSLLCWAPTGMSVTIYSNYHLHHHRIANTYPDVDNFVVLDAQERKIIAEVDRPSAMTQIHEGAIYGLQGDQFVIEKLDYGNRRAYARRVNADYFTEAEADTAIRVLTIDHEDERGRYGAFHGEVNVTTVAGRVGSMEKKVKRSLSRALTASIQSQVPLRPSLSTAVSSKPWNCNTGICMLGIGSARRVSPPPKAAR